MYYDAIKGDHGLPHNPFKAIVSPRPIGWISTQNAKGAANLAPYSFFNAVSDSPPMLGFNTSGPKLGSDTIKDTITNIRETGAFCVNIVSYDLREAMNVSSGHYDLGDDEFARAGLTKGTSKTINAPYVTEAPISMECKLYSIQELPGGEVWTMGSVLGIHIDDAHIKDGILDVTSYKPVARMGYRDYAVVEQVFSLTRPDET